MNVETAAPGPGSWTQDSTHFPRPITAYLFGVFKEPFIRGFKEGASRYGLMLSHLDYERVNGFMYSRAVPVGGPDDDEQAVPQRFAAAQTAFESRIWRADADRWDREIKPDSIRRNSALQSVDVQQLDDAGLSAHLDAVHDNAAEMFYRHHIFTVPSVFLIGHYLASVCEWTGLDSAKVLATLKGSSPVSCGATAELGRVGEALSDNGIHPADFDSGLSARQILDRLCERGDAVSEAIDAYLSVLGLKLVSGYDVADPCAIEMPDMLLKILWAAADEVREPETGQPDEDMVSVRDAVPDQYRPAFDELLTDARLINRLRDERGIYNDLWGTGIARWAILEAGRRLAGAGRLESADMAVDLTHDEMVSMLAGEQGPAAHDVSERGRWRRSATLDDVPETFGPPEPPPPSPEQLPEHARLAMRAFGTVIAEISTPEQANPESFVLGRGVSPGVYEGTARVVHDAAGFERLAEGDVLVTQATSASFNVVLPLLGAIVTDRGGQLSHAAIVAREYGVPAVVGTRSATARIADGDRVRVDGDSGRVDVL